MQVVQPKPTRLKPRLVEIFLQAGLLEVFGDDLAAGGQRRLHPWLGLQALLERVAGEQPGADQHRRVRRVGAGGDRGDRDVAMAEIVVGALDLVAVVDVGGLLVFGLHRLGEAGADIFQRDAAFGTLRSGHGRHHVAKIEIERVGEHRLGRIRLAPHALVAAIGLDQCDALLVAAGHGHVVQRLGVDREEAAGRAVFRAHVADRRAVGQRHVAKAGAEELDELADHALLAQHLRDGQHQVGRRDAFLQLAGEAEADDLRQQHGDRLAEHRGFRLDAADAPAEHAEAVDHRRVAVGADAGVGIGHDGAVLVLRPDGLAEIFEVHLVADAGAGRHDAEVLERLLAPFQEAVALAVALVLLLDIVGEGDRRAELVDDHRVVDHQVDRHQRVDLLRVAAERHHGVAHGRQVDDGGNAGEVLHEHARRAVGDLLAGRALVGEPVAHGLDVLPGDGLAILVAQQVFEQHLHREGQARDAGQAVLLGLREAEIGELRVAHVHGLAAS